MIQPMRKMLKLPAVLACMLSATAFACSNTPKPKPRTSFMGHAVGESSMAWNSKENFGDTDPLSKCQEIVRSPLLDQRLESAQRCQDFVDRGSYLIDLRETKNPSAKVFRFTNWTLSLFVVSFANEERARVTAELDSRFAKIVPGKVWSGEDGATIEIRPPEHLSLMTGKPASPGEFLVVVSDGRT
jgi:hypothetical protein